MITWASARFDLEQFRRKNDFADPSTRLERVEAFARRKQKPAE